MDIQLELAQGRCEFPSRISHTSRYKPSRFNALTFDSQHNMLLLYNSFTGHRCALPKETGSSVRAYLDRREPIPDPLDDLGNYLLGKGYLVPFDLDEDARWDVRYGISHFDMQTLQLTLLASEDYNFRCLYCGQEFKRGSMTPDVRMGVRNMVLSKIDTLSCLAISWFGGEPLLGYEAIEDLQPFFQHLCRERDVKLWAIMTSNGYLLTPDKSRALVEWGVTHYQLTIDGAAAQHDVHRMLPDGTGTFQRIYDNIAAMRQIDKEFTVNIRVNFDYANYPALDELFKQLAADFVSDSRFKLLFYPVSAWGGTSDGLLDLCDEKEAQSLACNLRKSAESYGLPYVHGAQFLEPGENACYASRPNCYVVGADGKLMKCTVVLDTFEDNIVGQLAEDGTAIMNETALLKWIRPYYRSDAACQKCSMVPVCEGASCPLSRVRDDRRPCPPHQDRSSANTGEPLARGRRQGAQAEGPCWNPALSLN